MHLIQLLLPLYDNEGAAFPQRMFEQVARELTDAFGGLTAYTRSPAEGRWQEEADSVAHDDLIVHEVMAEQLDHAWWRKYRESLEQRFAQDTLVIRAHGIELL